MWRHHRRNSRHHTRHYTLPEEVTEDDITINRHVANTLRHARPADNILTEEDGYQPGCGNENGDPGQGWTWVCDPIDGTYSYRVGLELACFSLALCYDGQPQVAVAATYGHQPETYWAIRGQGAWAKPHGATLDESARTTVHTNPHPADGVDISCGERNGAVIWRLTSAGIRATRCQSSVRGGLLTVAGRNAGWVADGAKAWDIAAITLLTQEAGGVVVEHPNQPVGNIFGRELRTIGAANRNVAEAIAYALRLAYNTDLRTR